MGPFKLPLVLRAREPLTSCVDNKEITYDINRDITVYESTQKPIIFLDEIGRTLLTESGKGVDQPEITEISVSSLYGRSTQTFTSEGIDQHETIEGINNIWGRTTITRTSEGLDTPSECSEIVG